MYYACRVEAQVYALCGRRRHGYLLVLLQDAVFRSPELGIVPVLRDSLVHSVAHVHQQFCRICRPIVVCRHTVVQVLHAQHTVSAILVEHGMYDVVRHPLVLVYLKEVLHFAYLGDDYLGVQFLILYGLVQFLHHAEDVGLCGERTLLERV